ncbi:MAG: carbon-phosphorus lyase, partial [Clostridia bacterium]|nr:carbon-phosphorus lyase [Clostridia bacterium]
MKLTYLGTAAAEGWPAVYCNCDHCKRAKAAGGRNIRTRSQALINDDLLIDYPADTYAHALANRLDLSAVRYLLFTHAHMDHCEPLDLAFR